VTRCAQPLPNGWVCVEASTLDALLRESGLAISKKVDVDARVYRALVEQFREVQQATDVALGSRSGSSEVQTDDVGERALFTLKTSDAASLLGVSGSYVSQLARSRQLRWIRVDGWARRFDPDDVQRFKEKRTA
jgi:excisionase family DNA binding protein